MTGAAPPVHLTSLVQTTLALAARRLRNERLALARTETAGDEPVDSRVRNLPFRMLLAPVRPGSHEDAGDARAAVLWVVARVGARLLRNRKGFADATDYTHVVFDADARRALLTLADAHGALPDVEQWRYRQSTTAEVYRALGALEAAPPWLLASIGELRYAAERADACPAPWRWHDVDAAGFVDVVSAIAAIAEVTPAASAESSRWLRVVSAQLLNDSKALGRRYPRLTSLLRALDPRWEGEGAPADDRALWAEYGLRDGVAEVRIATSLAITPPTPSSRVHALGDYPYGTVVPANWLPSLVTAYGEALAAAEREGREAPGVHFIENLTSFLQESEQPQRPGALLVYTQGFADRTVLQLAAMLGALPARGPMTHWGDADPAGLQIWWTIRRAARVPIHWVRTTPPWIASKVTAGQGHALSGSERLTLEKLAGRLTLEAQEVGASDLQEVRDVIAALLQHDRKLEQELWHRD